MAILRFAFDTGGCSGVAAMRGKREGMEGREESCEAAEAQGERGPGLAVALALMVLGALCASVWWGIVVAVFLLRD